MTSLARCTSIPSSRARPRPPGLSEGTSRGRPPGPSTGTHVHDVRRSPGWASLGTARIGSRCLIESSHRSLLGPPWARALWAARACHE
eukprot:4765994-Prymnesium_polylepis.1